MLEDLSSLEDRLWLVIDDAHELGSSEALRQLALVAIARAGPGWCSRRGAICGWAFTAYVLRAT